MFNKKMKLFFVTLIFMLSISAVAATEVNTSDDVAIGDVDDEPPSGNVQEVSDEEVKTSDKILLTAVNSDNDSYASNLSATGSNPTLSGKDVELYYKNGSSYVVILLDNGKAVKNATVKIVINNVVYNKVTNSYGKASVKVNLAPGNYTATASYGKSSIKNRISVLPVVSGSDVAKTYGSSTYYTAKFLDGHGKALPNTYVNFTLNGKRYSIKTNAYGVAKLPLNLSVGSYKVYAIHPNGFKISNTITVTSSIESSYFCKHYNTNRNFSATFFNKKGNPLANTNVKFILDNKVYSVKTNSEGVAVLPITLGIGSYKITSVNPTTGQEKTNTVVVYTSVKSSNMTKRFNSSKSFSVTFYGLDDKVYANKNVKFVVDGTTYTVKTNSKGVAVLPVTLGVGKHEVTSVNPATGQKVVNRITVYTSVKSSNMTKRFNSSKSFSVTFYGLDDKVYANKNVKFVVDGRTYTVKTDSNGIAVLPVTLGVGKHEVTSVNPATGQKVVNRVTVYNSIKSSGLTMRFGSSKSFSATFYGLDDKVYTNKNVKFVLDGHTYTVKTDSQGVAVLPIDLGVGTYEITSINPVTGQKVVNKINVRSTLIVKKELTTFTDKNTDLAITLYKNEKLVENANVYVYVNGVKYTLKTNKNGIAHYKFQLSKGNYVFTIQDPYTGYCVDTTVYVKAPSIKAKNMEATAKTDSTYEVTVLNHDGSVRPNANVKISINGNEKTVKTNSKGIASVKFNLAQGTYKVTCTDLSTGYTITKKITVTAGKKYNKYGVSSDGKTILAIGRASASGEYSKYGYTFYVTEFERTCSCCGGHNLYWSIFWAGNEYTNYGVFPATGNKEGSSAEGAIFCADCDSDWSVFGHNHGGSGGDLKVVTKTAASTKAAAYELKSGSYVKS